MGQRHMTYFYISSENKEGFGALYNQWNYATIQVPKIIRFERQLAKWRRNKDMHYPSDYSDWVRLYMYIASISDDTTDIHYRDMFDEYDKNEGMYEEDNNDGWQFVIIKVKDIDDRYNVPVKVVYGFRPNWQGEKKGKEFVNLYDNLLIDDKSKKESYKFHTIDKYLENFNKKDREIIQHINGSFDLKVVKEAEGKIKGYIDTIRFKKNDK